MKWNQRGMVVCLGLFVVVLGLLAVQSVKNQKAIQNTSYASEEDLVSLTERTGGESKSKAVTGEGASVYTDRQPQSGKEGKTQKEETASQAEQTPSARQSSSQKAGKAGSQPASDKEPAKTKRVVPKSEKTQKKIQGKTVGKTPVPPTPTPVPAVGTEKPSKAVVSLEIQCRAILDKQSLWREGLEEIIPESGIFYSGQCTFSQGETVYDVLKRICKEKDIALDSSYTPIYGSYYIRGIGNLYEFDCGSESGWKYAVNGVTPGVGASQYTIQNKDKIIFFYSTE